VSTLTFTGLTWLILTNIINLRQLKTDPFLHGHQVLIFPTFSSTCLVKAFKLCIPHASSTSSADPLFNTGRFSPLSQVSLNKALRHLLSQAGLNQSNFASHSFRIGAATAAAAAGIPSWIIKSLGRWASNAYLTYIHRSPSLMPAIMELMSRTDTTNQASWEADSNW